MGSFKERSLKLNSFKLLISAALLLIHSPFAFADDCDGLLFSVSTKDIQEGIKKRKALSKVLIDLEMDKTAYISRWSTKNEKAKGHLLEKGDTLVSGISTDKLDSWMLAIGQHSIGIGTFGLPEENSIAAAIRVGDQLYPFDYIQGDRLPVNFKKALNNNNEDTVGFTEATFMLRPDEIEAIHQFFTERREGRIVAQTDDVPGYKKGQVLNPKYDHSGHNLKNESCAAACTSFLSDMWLDNMNNQDLANSLRALRDRINANFNYVTRRNIYENFRNPHAHISVFAIEKSERGLISQFIKRNGWGLIRGLYDYAFMPDGGVIHEVQSYKSARISLQEYLEEAQ